MSKPKVSVIMSSYNHASFLEKAITSVVNQTYSNIEFIIIDDGSKDKSPEILKSLQRKYGFHLELRENYGLVATLNYILKNLVTGKYVCGIASDDFWVLDKIEKMVKLMEQNPDCGLGHSDVYIVNQDNKILNKKDNGSKVIKKHVFKDFLLNKYNINAPSTIVPYSIYKEVLFYDENFSIEDYQMWLNITSRYPVIYTTEKLTYYRKHDNNMSNDNSKMLFAEEQIVNSWTENELFQDVQNKVYLRFFSRFSKNHKSKAIKYLLKSISVEIIKEKDFYKGMRRLLFYWKNDEKNEI